LSVRMRQHCEGAMAVAQHLVGHPRVKKVNYPGLADHPEHSLARSQMRGFGGMVSFVVDGTPEQAERVALRLKLFKTAASLGGVESLVGYPKFMSHVSLTPEERAARSIPDNLLRLSIGLEDPDDLKEDLDQALDFGA
jgi:cystathionine beta-lyase/cystathionine gamma-synthase